MQIVSMVLLFSSLTWCVTMQLVSIVYYYVVCYYGVAMQLLIWRVAMKFALCYYGALWHFPKHLHQQVHRIQRTSGHIRHLPVNVQPIY